MSNDQLSEICSSYNLKCSDSYDRDQDSTSCQTISVFFDGKSKNSEYDFLHHEFLEITNDTTANEYSSSMISPIKLLSEDDAISSYPSLCSFSSVGVDIKAKFITNNKIQTTPELADSKKLGPKDKENLVIDDAENFIENHKILNKKFNIILKKYCSAIEKNLHLIYKFSLKRKIDTKVKALKKLKGQVGSFIKKKRARDRK